MNWPIAIKFTDATSSSKKTKRQIRNQMIQESAFPLTNTGALKSREFVCPNSLFLKLFMALSCYFKFQT